MKDWFPYTNTCQDLSILYITNELDFHPLDYHFLIDKNFIEFKLNIYYLWQQLYSIFYHMKYLKVTRHNSRVHL